MQEYKVPAKIDALCKYTGWGLTRSSVSEIYHGVFDNKQAKLYLSIDDIVWFYGMKKIVIVAQSN